MDGESDSLDRTASRTSAEHAHKARSRAFHRLLRTTQLSPYPAPLALPDYERASGIPPERQKNLVPMQAHDLYAFKGRFGPLCATRRGRQKNRPSPPSIDPEGWRPKRSIWQKALRLLALAARNGCASRSTDCDDLFQYLGVTVPYRNTRQHQASRAAPIANLRDGSMMSGGNRDGTARGTCLPQNQTGQALPLPPQLRRLGEHPEFGGPIQCHEGHNYGPLIVKWGQDQRDPARCDRPATVLKRGRQAVDLDCREGCKGVRARKPAKKKAAPRKSHAAKKPAAKEPAAKEAPARSRRPKRTTARLHCFGQNIPAGGSVI